MLIHINQLLICRNSRIDSVTMPTERYDRFFGIKGSWKPLSQLLLSIEKIDVMKGYEEGNLMILMWRFNDARFRFMWVNFLKWRRGVLGNRAAFNRY